MHIIPKQVNLAIVSNHITPEPVVATIFQNGRYIRTSEAQSLQFRLYIYRLPFQKKYCRIHHVIVSVISEAN